jgi:hypothetical protein
MSARSVRLFALTLTERSGSCLSRAIVMWTIARPIRCKEVQRLLRSRWIGG